MRAVALLLALGLMGSAQTFVGGDILFDLAGGARRAGMGGVGIAISSPEALFGNPGSLAWVEGLHVTSAYTNPFGAAHVGSVDLAFPGLGAGVVLLEAGAVGPGLRYRTAGALVGTGVRLGPFGIGFRARLLRPVAPVLGLGGALDVGLLWRGPVHVGAVGRGILSRSPVAGEPWAPEFSLGVALPIRLGELGLTLAADLLDLERGVSFALGAELGLGPILLRAGYGPGGPAFGGTAAWGFFALDWAVLLHPVLPAAFRVSFALRL